MEPKNQYRRRIKAYFKNTITIKISSSMQNKKNKWQKFWLDYFDFNKDGITNWWEYTIPFLIVLLVEILAELVVRIILN